MTNDFANQLQRLLQTADLSVPQVASRSGVPADTIHNWTKRKTLKPHWPSLLRVLWCLDVKQPHLDELLTSMGYPRLDHLASIATPAEQAICARWTATSIDHAEPSQLNRAYQLLRGLATNRLPDVRPLAIPSAVPLKPNILCVGRKAILRVIGRQLAKDNDGRPVVLMGEGGMGKTLLANEVVHRYGPFFAGGVWWVSCAQPDLILRTYSSWIGPGKLQEIPGFADLSPDRQLALVKQALSEPIPRLLVFDECEDPAILQSWIPSHGGCRVVVTSRSRVWDSVATYPLVVAPLDRAASLTLLSSIVPEIDHDTGNTIAAEVGDLPLALHLAARYIQRYRYHITPDRYLNTYVFPALRSQTVDGLAFPVKALLAPSLARLDPACVVDKLALDLLQTVAWCVPGTLVPRDLCQSIWITGTSTVGKEGEYFQHEEAMTRLSALGLVQDQGNILIHPLLAYLVREQFGPSILNIVLERLTQLFAPENAEMQARTRSEWLPHLQALAQYSIEQQCHGALAYCLELGQYCWRIGAGADGYQWTIQALELAKAAGNEHGIDAALNILSLCLLYLGRYSEAEQCSRDRLKRLAGAYPDERHGEELSNLGFLLMLQGRYAEATSAFRQALRIRAAAHGVRSRQVGYVLHNLGYLALKQGRLGRAHRLLMAALSIRSEPGTPALPRAFTISTLGEVFLVGGNPDVALTLFDAGYDLRKQHYDCGHPVIAESQYLRACALLELGQHHRVTHVLQEAIKITKDTMGDIHRQMVFLLTAQGRLALDESSVGDSFALLCTACEVAESALGSTHPETATVWFWRGVAAMRQSRWNEAEQALDHVRQLRNHLWGGHYQHGEVALALASVLHHQDRYEEAHKTLLHAWTAACRANTAAHPVFQTCHRALRAWDTCTTDERRATTEIINGFYRGTAHRE